MLRANSFEPGHRDGSTRLLRARFGLQR
jgi:hypothetical protein